jgi:hypothetical protein
LSSILLDFSFAFLDLVYQIRVRVIFKVRVRVRVMLFNVMLCYVMLCYVMLYYNVSSVYKLGDLVLSQIPRTLKFFETTGRRLQ